jgi:putative transposase
MRQFAIGRRSSRPHWRRSYAEAERAKSAAAGTPTRRIFGCTDRWKYLYRAIDRDGALVDVMLSDHRNLAAAKRFFRSAKAVTGVIPDRVTTDGHDAYPQAIRLELGSCVWHRTNCYLNNRLEQDHRGIKGRCRPMLGFKSVPSARRYCRGYDELRNFLRSRSRMCQHVPAATRRFHYMRRTAIALGMLEAA